MNETASQATGVLDWNSYIPSDDTEALIEAAREHFASLFSLDELRRVLDGKPHPALWPELVDYGYPVIGLPEDRGGIGSFIDLLALLEEAGRALLPAPLLTCAMATQTLLAAAQLDEATCHAALSFGQLHGHEVIAFDGADAEFVVATEAAGHRTRVHLFSVADAPRRPLPAVDPVHPSVLFERSSVAAVSFDVEAAQDSTLAGARLCVAADLIGVASRALDASVEHALTRVQFGRAIGSFQAVKHQLADAYVALERARSLMLGGGVALTNEASPQDGARLSMLAKAAAAEAAARCTALQTQLLGAMGLTFESDSPLCVRRARHTMPLLGSAGELYARVAASTTGGA